MEVIEAHDGPEETGYTDKIKTRQESYLLKILSGRTIDAFYSSEPYGEHVSKAFGCANRIVDVERKINTISSTLIRQDFRTYQHWLHPIVRTEIIPRLVF